jgi:hypothetical protein
MMPQSPRRENPAPLRQLEVDRPGGARAQPGVVAEPRARGAVPERAGAAGQQSRIEPQAQARGVPTRGGFQLAKHARLRRNRQDAHALGRLLAEWRPHVVHSHLDNDHRIASVAVARPWASAAGAHGLRPRRPRAHAAHARRRAPRAARP